MVLTMPQESSDAYLIKQLTWDFFVTLTWAKNPSYRFCVEDLLIWVRAVKRSFSIDRLGYVARWETGGIGGRLHVHLLCRGFSPSQRHISGAKALQNMWGEGLARVSVFDQGRGDIARYLSKSSYEVGRYRESHYTHIVWNGAAWAWSA